MQWSKLKGRAPLATSYLAKTGQLSTQHAPEGRTIGKRHLPEARKLSTQHALEGRTAAHEQQSYSYKEAALAAATTMAIKTRFQVEIQYSGGGERSISLPETGKLSTQHAPEGRTAREQQESPLYPRPGNFPHNTHPKEGQQRSYGRAAASAMAAKARLQIEIQ